MPKFSGYWDNDGHWPSRLPGQPLLSLMPARSMKMDSKSTSPACVRSSPWPSITAHA